MSTLHTFGCSLTASTNWPDKLANRLGLSLINHAVPAGDNLTQIRRFKDNILNNKIDRNDHVLWEITYLNRLGFRLSEDHHFFTKHKDNVKINHNFHNTSINLVDGKRHVDYVAFNEDWYDVNWYIQNVSEMLSELLYTIRIANERTQGKCLVWFAENNIFENDFTKKNFLSYLKDNAIDYIDYETSSLMSWTKENNFPLDDDGMHPASTVYEDYSQKFLQPRIKA